jgi:hypothetical protein
MRPVDRDATPDRNGEFLCDASRTTCSAFRRVPRSRNSVCPSWPSGNRTYHEESGNSLDVGKVCDARSPQGLYCVSGALWLGRLSCFCRRRICRRKQLPMYPAGLNSMHGIAWSATAAIFEELAPRPDQAIASARRKISGSLCEQGVEEWRYPACARSRRDARVGIGFCSERTYP